MPRYENQDKLYFGLIRQSQQGWYADSLNFQRYHFYQEENWWVRVNGSKKFNPNAKFKKQQSQFSW